MLPGLAASIVLRRRSVDELLRGTAQGQTCRAAYRYELRNTRLTLRLQPRAARRLTIKRAQRA